jgi:glucuronoarabinoxylan endo-1,4-beta-xylanase
MLNSKIKLNLLFLYVISFYSCGKHYNIATPPAQVIAPVTVTINLQETYQTIDGFGFYGANDVWWGDASTMWNEAWGEKVISDLGISIWRNEIFPPAVPGSPQDADWNKQLPVVKGLKAKADKYNVDLKFIATVWSPPADLKWECKMSWAGDPDATRNPGIVSTKNGGTLNPNKYGEYADWLKSNIQLYKDAGINLYALSFQNELMFKQTYNSCIYTIPWYNDLLVAVTPKVKQSFPALKIFGSENMLEMEGRDDNWQWFYHSGLKANTEATKNIDILAVHGYSDGVAASSGSALGKMWTNHKEKFSSPMNKPVWMTETSGYAEAWEKTGDKPGALNLAMDIHSALYFGNASAWVWWQGSGSGAIDEFSLMSGTTVGKKYQVSKHFYRYIRPGAVRVQSQTDNENIFVSAFKNSAKGTNTIVVINSGNIDKTISLDGVGLPSKFKMYRTNSSNENCVLINEVSPGKNGFVLPAKSIITLQAGGDAL